MARLAVLQRVGLAFLQPHNHLCHQQILFASEVGEHLIQPSAILSQQRCGEHGNQLADVHKQVLPAFVTG